VAIDAERQLFNGAPGVVAPAIDALGLAPGERVLHIGCGLGYYTALMAHIVDPSGRVRAIEVDDTLAADSARNLSPYSWVEVQHGNGAGPLGEPFDAVLVNAGVTHPHDTWLDALVPGGRLVLPMTATLPQMKTIGKGLMLLLTKASDEAFDVRPLTLVAIYSAVGLRDETLNEALGRALMRPPFARPTRLRRDAHDPEASCWLHGPTFCLG